MATTRGLRTAEERVPSDDGLTIFVRSWHPEGLARAVVVIVHGFNSHSGEYAWAASQLVAAGLAVYAPDLRGRGKSDGERFFVNSFGDWVADVAKVISLAKSRESGLPVFVLGHSAGGVVACIYTLEHQSELAGLVCESFAHEVPAPDFALAVFKGLSHVAPHAHILRLKNEDFSRDPQVVQAKNTDPLISLVIWGKMKSQRGARAISTSVVTVRQLRAVAATPRSRSTRPASFDVPNPFGV